MKKLAIIFIIALLSACAVLETEFNSSRTLGIEPDLTFKSRVDQTTEAVKAVFAEKGWSYRANEEPPRDLESTAKELANSSTPARMWIQGKTPTSAFSYGTALLVVLLESPDRGTIVYIATKTDQALEKDKLVGYINEFAARLNEILD